MDDFSKNKTTAALARRDFLKRTAAVAAAALPVASLAGEGIARAAAASRPKLISTEEAFIIPEVVEELKKLAGGKPSMTSGPIAGPFMPKLLDLGAGRIAQMDADGVDIQVLGLTSPGVQKFDADIAVAMSTLANDRLGEALKAHPDRFVGMATVAPQKPEVAAKEMERAVKKLGMKGVMINSHTNGEYLSETKYWPILEAAEALDVPIYIHPRDPVPDMAKTVAVPGFVVGWAYSVETGTHLLSMIGAGVFDKFPKLQVAIGHMGESIPLLLDRIDNRNGFELIVTGRKPLPLKPSEYFKRNVTVTTSGMNFKVPLKATLEILGADRMMFAADYPFEDQKQAVAEYMAIDISDEDRRKLSEDTARRVFKI